MEEDIISTKPNSRCKQTSYYFSCGSNVDGRLGIGGTNESCRTFFTPLAKFGKERWKSTGDKRRLRISPSSFSLYDDNADIASSSPWSPDKAKDGDDEDDEDMEGLCVPPAAFAMSSGRAHTLCVCRPDGCVYGWGSNDRGQLGLHEKAAFKPMFVDGGEEEDVNEFIEKVDPLPILMGVRVATVACGYNHSLLMSSTGALYSFGGNSFGELGLGDTSDRSAPSPVTIDAFVVAAAGGLNHTLALTLDGDVYAFGRGQEGQLGDGISLSQEEEHKCLTPKKVEGNLLGNPVILIAASSGGHGSYAVTASDGNGWYWGAMVLDGTERMACPTPLPPPLGASTYIDDEPPSPRSRNNSFTTQTSTSSATSKSILPTLLSKTPQLPSTTTSTQTPQSSHRIISLSAGSHHLICVTLSGEAFALGQSGSYLGLGPGCQFNWTSSAARMLLPGDALINGVCCGVKHTLLSTTLGKVLVCGDGSWGKLGLDGDALNKGSGREAVPKIVELGVPRSRLVSRTMGEGSAGCEAILRNLVLARERLDKEKEGEQQQMEEEDYYSYEDDEDYWGEEGLGHELEMDFNLVYGSGNPFGGSESMSWKNRLSSEARRRLSSGTRAVGGAILTTGGAVISGVASAVKSRVRGGSISSSGSDGGRSKSEASLKGGIPIGSKSSSTTDHSYSKKNKDAIVVGSVDSHQDSFDGLAGKARRQIILSAGVSHSCVHIFDNIDDE